MKRVRIAKKICVLLYYIYVYVVSTFLVIDYVYISKEDTDGLVETNNIINESKINILFIF